MYPLNGNVPSSIGHVQSSRLALSRYAYKMHREALARGTMGSAGLCKKYLMPIMRKQQYRFQMVNPIPTVSGRFACSAIGASTMPLDAGRAYPAGGRGHGLSRLAQTQLLRSLGGLRCADIFGASDRAVPRHRQHIGGAAQSVDGIDRSRRSRSAQPSFRLMPRRSPIRWKDRGMRSARRRPSGMTAAWPTCSSVAKTDLPKGPAGPVDFDEIGRRRARTRRWGRQRGTPVHSVWRATSMPLAQALKQLDRRYRARAVWSSSGGFPEHSMKEFSSALGRS